MVVQMLPSVHENSVLQVETAQESETSQVVAATKDVSNTAKSYLDDLKVSFIWKV